MMLRVKYALYFNFRSVFLCRYGHPMNILRRYIGERKHIILYLEYESFLVEASEVCSL